MKLNKKFKILTIFLSMFLLLGATNVFAQTPSLNVDKSTEIQLKELEEKYGNIEFVNLNSKTKTSQDLIDFKSVEELDKYIENFQKNKENLKDIELETSISKSTTRIKDTDTISWYTGFSNWPLNTMLGWCNVTLSYDYNWKNGRPYFTSTPSSVSSYVSGLNVASWHQTGKAVNLTKKYSTNDTAKVKVNGYYLLGISINGAPIGYTQKDTWNCSLTLVP